MRLARPLNKPAITQSILADTSSMFGIPSGNPFTGNASVASMSTSANTNNML
ncbi:hypothetical protein IFR05_016578 [Cadophora sp. M221]|nr:hypothetical protein IFR05_016578 [Cadophora sp. M221]